MTGLRLALLGATALLGFAPLTALAQSNYPSVGGANVSASAAMCINGSGQAVPVSATCPFVTSTTLTGTGANNADTVASVATGLSSVDSYNFVYNGTTWDRARGDTTSGAWVNIKNTTVPVTLPTAPTIAAGNGVVDTPSSEALAGIVPVISAALESNKVICAAPCNFYGGYITTGATAGWLLLANATSAPTAGGAAIAPIACVLAPANQTTSISGPASAPIRASTGIVMVFSTSGCLTNTASTTAFFSGQAK